MINFNKLFCSNKYWKKLIQRIVFSSFAVSLMIFPVNAADIKNFDKAISIFNSLNFSNFDNSHMYKKLAEKISEMPKNSGKFVIPCGTPFGIKMFSSGSLVVSMGDVQTQFGLKNPARESGLRKGDVIKMANGTTISNNSDLAKIIENSNGSDIKICAIRNNSEIEMNVVPVKSSVDEEFKIGAWVRNSSAGIGTMTFYDPKTKIFAGLGHGIYDPDTDNLFPLQRGEIVDTSIIGASPGQNGLPGELKGSFVSRTPSGKIFKNSACGVYGVFEKIPKLNSDNSGHTQIPIEIATKNEIKIGKAQILTTLFGNKPEYYDVKIESINNSKDPTKNIFFVITDENLLSKTGGILQGMSGSPIIQNGKLLGAVTHVVVNKPNKGYGIFAERMLLESSNITDLI